MISYGGIPLICPDPETVARIQAAIDLDGLYLADQPDYTGNGDWRAADYAHDHVVKLGRLYWPRGASQWACGRFLATEDQLDDIREQTYDSESGLVALTLKIDDGVNDPLETEMFMRPPRPLHQWDDGQNLYLLELVDERFFWWWQSIDHAGEVTWGGVFGAITDALDLNGRITIESTDLEDSFSGPSSVLDNHWEYLPLYFDAAAYSTQKRVVRRLDGKVFVQVAHSSDVIVNGNPDDDADKGLIGAFKDSVYFGGFYNFDEDADHSDLVTAVPDTIRMRFPTQTSDLPPSTENPPYVVYDQSLDDLSDDLDGFAETVVTSGVKTVHAFLGAEMDYASNVTNESSLTDLVKAWSVEWYKWQRSPTTIIYGGIKLWDGDGGVDYVEWSAYEATGSGTLAPEMLTRVSRDVMNDMAENVYVGDSASTVEGIFPATLTRSDGYHDGVWRYAYTRDTFSTPDTQMQGLSESGTIQPVVTTEHTQTEDLFSPDVYTITVVGGTGGTYTLTDGSTTSAIAFDATDSAINSALTAISSTFSSSSSVSTNSLGVTTRTHTFTSSAVNAAHSISMDFSGLEPKAPHYPAVFRNNLPMGTPVAVWLKLAEGKAPNISWSVQQQGDGTSQHAILVLALKHMRDGSYKLRFTTDDPWQTLAWNASAGDIQTALSSLLTCTVAAGTVTADEHTFTITITADFDPHKLLIDKGTLVGTAFYVVIWSNGNACTGPFGGLMPSVISGYVGKVAPTISVTQTFVGDSGAQNDTFVLQVNDANGGAFYVVADGDTGSPVDTAWNACPSISGWTVTTNTDGTCTLVAPDSTPGHTIDAYKARLRSEKAKFQFFGTENDCATLVGYTQCQPTELGG